MDPADLEVYIVQYFHQQFIEETGLAHTLTLQLLRFFEEIGDVVFDQDVLGIFL